MTYTVGNNRMDSAITAVLYRRCGSWSAVGVLPARTCLRCQTVLDNIDPESVMLPPRRSSLLIGVSVYGPDATHELECVLELGVLVLLRGDVRRTTILLLTVVALAPEVAP